MSAFCAFCHHPIKLGEKYFKDENGEFAHTDCLLERLERLKLRGVNPELLAAIQAKFMEPPKKKKAFFFKA